MSRKNKQTPFSIIIFCMLFVRHLHRYYLAVAVMYNPELVEWAVVSAFDELVAAALRKSVAEERVPETVNW